jgi:Apea-like HEPN
MLTFVVLPFLKTRQPVKIGSLLFRSTDDVTGLDESDASRLREIAGMLYLKDDLLIKTASYATAPALDLDRPSQEVLQPLADAQSVIAYIYATPHPTLGDPFLPSESASMVILLPAKVSIFAARPAHHTVDQGTPLTIDERHQVDGFHGLRDFKHHFWSAAGSRLYGSLPQATLNISQDLGMDIEQSRVSRRDCRLLLELLSHPETESSRRMLAAVQWFNKANRENSDDSDSILALSIAFETLLKLPTDAKTSNFKDTVSLLLGRLPRLDQWAEQFYGERSRVVHEGRAARLRFEVGNVKQRSTFQEYQSLVSYGRHIFQLCLGTLLEGLRVAEEAGIEEKLVTNQERFEKLCRLLDGSAAVPSEQLESAKPLISAILRYRFVPESNLLLATALGACRRVAGLVATEELRPALRSRLQAFATAKTPDDHFGELQQLGLLADELTDEDLQSNYISDDLPRVTLALRLMRDVWHDVFMHYFWLKEQRERSAPVAPGETTPGSQKIDAEPNGPAS